MTLELVPWRGHNVPIVRADDTITRYTTQDYINWLTSNYRWMAGGQPAPLLQTTYGDRAAEPISNSFEGLASGMLMADGPVAAVQAYRLRVFGQAPALYQKIVNGRPGDLFDDDRLNRLRKPWAGANQGDLMKRALLYADLAGNAFVLDMDDELVLVRPDWVEIVLAKREYRGGQVGWRQLGILYYEGGLRASVGVPFSPGEYSHFVPGLPDPLATYRGMSWLTPLMREVQADKAAMDHKVAFFEHAATPNLAVSLPKEITPAQFSAFVDRMDEQHRGALNAGKTLYTAGGADVTVIGANMRDVDFSAVVGKGETRVANAGGVPPTLLSFSEGMQGSSLNSGNYVAAKRNFVDTTMRDLWANWCGSISLMDAFAPPERSRLWYDERDIPFLREDQTDAATIQEIKARTIGIFVMNGFKPDSAVKSVDADDRKLLEHTGLVSVQLLPPGEQTGEGGPTAPDGNPLMPDGGDAAGTGDGADQSGGMQRADGSFYADDDVSEDDEGDDGAAIRAILDVMDDEETLIALLDEIERKYNPAQLRQPAGTSVGGQWRTISSRVMADLQAWLNAGGGHTDPLGGRYSQPQLKAAAIQLGLNPPKGMKLAPLKALIMSHARTQHNGAASPAPHVTQPGVPGTVVATPFAGGPFLSQYTQSLRVTVGTTHIGAVHEDMHGHWTADPVGGLRAHFTPPPAGATKQQALAALTAAHAASLAAGTAPAPAGAVKVSTRVAGAPNVTQLSITPKPVPPGSPSWQMPAKQSFEIYVGGTKVGEIHQHGYGWVAETAAGNPVTAGRTKTAVVQALVAQHQSSGWANMGTGRVTLPSGATVTLTNWRNIPGRASHFGSAPNAASFDVTYSGVDIGDIHTPDAYNTTWTIMVPRGASYALPNNSFSTKEDALQALVDAHNAHLVAQAAGAGSISSGSVTLPSGATVTLTDWRTIPGSAPAMSSAPGAASFAVTHNGVDVGNIHAPTGGSTTWTVHVPNTAWYALPSTGRPGGTFSTKEDALQALVDAHNAHLVAQAGAGSAPAPSSAPVPLGGKLGFTRAAGGGYDVNVNGVMIGHVAQPNPGRGGWRYRMAGSTTWERGIFPSRIQAAASLHAQAAASSPSPSAPPAPSAPPTPLAHDPIVVAAQDVLYGNDPKGKTATRQLQVYGAMRRAHFDQLSTAEQSTLLGDLSYIATTSKGPSGAKAQKLIDRFSPPGTPSGSVPKQAVHVPAGVAAQQTRLPDAGGRTGMLTVLPAGKRGRSGDGWHRLPGGGTGPWGQYGAAGLMLRHVDDQGVERFLMIERGPAISDPGKWQFPGGAIDEHETEYEGATRETLEELGFKPADFASARVHGTHRVDLSGTSWSYTSIAATVDSQLKPDLSTHHARAETSDAKWMTRQEIQDLDRKGKLLAPLAGGQVEQNVMSLFPPGGGPGRPGPVHARPARLTGAPSVPKLPTRKPSRGRDLMPDRAAKDKLRQDVKRARKKFAGKVPDDRLAAIAEMQGFDETPTVVSTSEFDRLLATGDYFEVWRGVSGNGRKTARQIHEDMRSGPAYFGTGSMFGNGYYFAADPTVLSGRYASGASWGGGQRYGDGTPGSVARVLIPRDAKIIQFDAARRGARAVASPYTRAKGAPYGEDGTLYDEGRYAAARGYDVIEVPHGTAQASHVTAPGKSTFVVVNRSVLIVEEDVGRRKAK